MAYSQNLNFTDSKFKALLLSSNTNNQIAKDSSGNFIAIDTNGDGDIQVSEAAQITALTIKQDPNQMYIDPDGNLYDPNNVNTAYYNSHLPDGISDALLFPNLEELYFWDTKAANIGFINNSKIRKVQGMPVYYGFTSSSIVTNPAPINLLFDNCSGIQNISDVIAYQATMLPWTSPENSLTIKNCSQINSNAVVDSAGLQELYIENSNIGVLTFNSCALLEKISVPNLNTLTSISVLGDTGMVHDLELIANNCINLQEIVAETNIGTFVRNYFTSVNLNGCTSLKKIVGLNPTSINFSSAGLINLEELDCSYYNKLGYYATPGITFGNLTYLNLAGLPKLKKLKAFNQPITNDINFSTATTLEKIDITNSCGYMTAVNANNLPNLTTLKTDIILINATSPDLHFDLQQINAQNCTALTDLQIGGNYDLKSLNLQNCSSLPTLNLGTSPISPSIYFPELNSLNIKQCTALEDLSITHTKLTELNASNCIALSYLTLEYNANLTYANIQNGSIENTIFSNNNANLAMCVDSSQLSDLQNTYPDIIFTSNCENVLSTNSVSKENEIDIFPNPAKDSVQVKSSDIIKNIQLFDQQGRLILERIFNQNLVKIDLSSYPNGIYMMKIITGKTEISKKIIKN